MIIIKTIDFYTEDEEWVEIECEVHYIIQNDGIGHYEYWGAPGYDAGFDYVEVEDIIPPDKKLNKFIDDNFDKLAGELAIKIEEDGMRDYDDPW